VWLQQPKQRSLLLQPHWRRQQLRRRSHTAWLQEAWWDKAWRQAPWIQTAWLPAPWLQAASSRQRQDNTAERLGGQGTAVQVPQRNHTAAWMELAPALEQLGT